MALISCPNCGKEISDKAKKCPACGHTFIEEEIAEQKAVVCEECGLEIPDDATACPNCGCPIERESTTEESQETVQKVEVTSVNVPVNKGTVKKVIAIIVAAVVVVVIAVAIALGVNSSNKKKSLSNYATNYDSAITTILTGASTAERCGNLIKSVWYNTIYEKSDPSTDQYTRKKGYLGTYGSFYDDFNTSLSLLFLDSSFSSDISSIESNQEKVASLMKQLNNPPEEYADAYDALKDLYEAYSELTNLATDPSGNLSTYSSNFNAADSKVSTEYNKVKLYMD